MFANAKADEWIEERKIKWKIKEANTDKPQIEWENTRIKEED